MRAIETSLALDREQLREVTLDDEDLMRELVAALIEDTERQLPAMQVAIGKMDGPQCARLAHYCKGACANLGALSAAEVLQQMEHFAREGSMDECLQQLAALATELDRLRAEEI